MAADSVLVFCGKCRAQLAENPHAPAEQRRPCPNCGDLSRHFDVQLSATVTVHSRLNMKARRPGMKRPFLEQTVGDDLHRKTGRWMMLERLIDRVKNWYREVVTDPRTGHVVHKSDEPLTDHQGRGSARKSPEG